MEYANQLALAGVIADGVALFFALLLVFIPPSIDDPMGQLAAGLGIGFAVIASLGIGLYCSIEGVIKKQTAFPIISLCISIVLSLTFALILLGYYS